MTTYSLAENNESHESPREKAQNLIKGVEKVTDSEIRKFVLAGIEKYLLTRDVTIRITKNSIEIVPKSGTNKAILLCLLSYAVIFTSAYLSFSQLGFSLGVGVVIGTYALATLMMGAILVMLGKIPPGDFLAMVKEGFKALNLLRRW
jgi:hypothetical protein